MPVRLTDALDRLDNPAERIAHGFVLTVTTLRTPGTLEPLTIGAGPLLRLAVQFTKSIGKAVPSLPEPTNPPA